MDKQERLYKERKCVQLHKFLWSQYFNNAQQNDEEQVLANRSKNKVEDFAEQKLLKLKYRTSNSSYGQFCTIQNDSSGGNMQVNATKLNMFTSSSQQGTRRQKTTLKSEILI